MASNLRLARFVFNFSPCGLRSTERHVLMQIGWLSDAHGQLSQRVDDLARSCRLQRRQLQAITARLEHLGLLRIHRGIGAGAVNTYTVVHRPPKSLRMPSQDPDGSRWEALLTRRSELIPQITRR